MNETLLFGKGKIVGMYNKLKDKPNDYSICPRCETVYDGRYEACKCLESAFR